MYQNSGNCPGPQAHDLAIIDTLGSNKMTKITLSVRGMDQYGCKPVKWLQALKKAR
jgi:hypothetical protein